MGRARVHLLLAGVVVVASALAGCGDESFDRRPERPPVPVQITGVITDEQVTVSPNRIGGGPIVLIVSNQTQRSRTVVLEGRGIRDVVGPIQPQDTATIQATLKQGRYKVRAGAERATSREVAPATIVVGKRRPTGEDQLLLP